MWTIVSLLLVLSSSSLQDFTTVILSENETDWSSSTDKQQPWKPQQGIILTASFSVIVLAVALLPLVWSFLGQQSKRTTSQGIVLRFWQNDDYLEKEEELVQEEYILCREEDAKYRYELIFRIGEPTKEFDLKHAYIDIEILMGKDDQVLGTATRFDCFKLPSLDQANLHFVFGMLMALKPLSGIRANHNDHHGGSILLYEYILLNARQEVIEVRQFNQYLTNKATIYRGKRVKYSSKKRRQDFKDRDNEDGADSRVYWSPTWSWTELLILISTILLLVGLLVMLFEYFNLYTHSQTEDGSLYRSVQDVFWIWPLATIISTFHVLLYWSLLKCSQKKKKTRIACHIYQGACIMLNILMAAVLVYLGSNISLVKSLYWLATLLLVNVLVLGLWSSVNAYGLWECCTSEKRDQAELQEASASSSPKSKSHHRIENHEQVKIRNNEDNKKDNSRTRTKNNVLASTSHLTSAIGPKMRNPKGSEHPLKKQQQQVKVKQKIKLRKEQPPAKGDAKNNKSLRKVK